MKSDNIENDDYRLLNNQTTVTTGELHTLLTAASTSQLLTLYINHKKQSSLEL